MNDSIQIIIDPGHGGTETGAVASGYKEKDLNLQISLNLYERVKAYFSNVAIVRNTDTYFGIAERAAWVKQKAEEFPGKTICLSIHLNAFDGTGCGAEVIYSIHSDPDLAQAIVNKICELGIPFRRIFSKPSETTPGLDYYCMNRETGKAQTVIVESLFLDNASDIAFLKRACFINNLAQKICDGLVAYTGVKAPVQQPVQVQPVQPHWAQKDHDELRTAGILENDHTGSLNNPATEGFVIALINRIRK